MFTHNLLCLFLLKVLTSASDTNAFAFSSRRNIYDNRTYKTKYKNNNNNFRFVQPLTKNSHVTAWLASSASETLPEISSMRISELKQELEAYGISTKSFLEKKELVEALLKARDESMTPVTTENTSSSSSTSTKKTKKGKKGAPGAASKTREEKIAEEIEKCQTMKANEIKKELVSMGISTQGLLEKKEFVQRLAEARVDGIAKKDEVEEVAVEVEVITDDSGPRARKPQQEQSSNGGNPFGGAGGGNPFGGAGAGGILSLIHI